MSEYFEIAYAAVSNRLCLFTGTGFSKAVTEDKAPGWQALLEAMCDLTDDPIALKDALFPTSTPKSLSLEEAAQVVSIELLKKNKSIHAEIARSIGAITLKGDYAPISNFLSSRQLKVVTTNYDKLVERLIGEKECHSLTPGLPIPRSPSRAEVYHVHGSIDSPENMVVTSDDYFKFLNSESYFSRKLSTVLHENTVVILGYSLGDTNLKAIISDYKGFSRNHVIGSNIFLVYREPVNQHVKDYYAHCYGIRVMDNTQVRDFFVSLNTSLPKAEKCAESSIENIKNVIYKGYKFTREFLALENSFYEILASIAATGLSLNNSKVTETIGTIIKTKIELTTGYNAWDQYEHLARWLIYLASILELKGTSIEDIYLKAALQSMTTMRRELYIGYSWHAFTAWNSRWSGIISSNRAMIKAYIEKNTTWADALSVVKRG